MNANTKATAKSECHAYIFLIRDRRAACHGVLRSLASFIIGLAAMVCICNASPPDAPKNSSASKLVGTWKLISIEERDVAGKLTVPLDYGTEPVGLLMYDTTGHMSAQAMRRNRAPLPSDDVHLITPEQAKAALTSYNAYFGTYRVIESESVVIHHVEGGMIPNWLGGDQRRKFTLDGDKLILEPPPIQAGGTTRVRRLTWQRVR